LHILTFMIRSAVSPQGATENFWENPHRGKMLISWFFIPESDQIKNLKAT